MESNLIPIQMSDEELLIYLIGENTPEDLLEEVMKEWNSRRKKDGGYDATQFLLGD